MGRWIGLGAGLALFVLAAPANAEPRASYLSADEVPGNGIPMLLDVSTGGEYRREIDHDKLHGATDVGAFELHTRGYLGRRVAYCVGFDGDVGGSERGFVGAGTVWLTGVGLRFGDAAVLALCGGLGVSGMHNAVPTAGDVPAELRVGSPLGPLRGELWARPQWMFGENADVRRHGTFIHAVDELTVGADIRFERTHRYWGTQTGGGGFALGVQYGELMGTRTLGFTLGFDFTGAR